MRAPRQPYALETPSFTFAAIAACAARAPIGGPREIALATYVIARLVDDTAASRRLPAEHRRARGASARRWLSTIAIAEPARRALTDLATATEADDPEAVGPLRHVIEVTSGVLDTASRQDLERLAGELESQPIVRT